MTTCPKCNGRCQFTNLYDGVSDDGRKIGWTETVPCSLCKGVGEMSDEDLHAYEQRRAAGQALKSEHQAVPGYNISAMAVSLGVATRTLLRVYNGILSMEEAKAVPLSDAESAWIASGGAPAKVVRKGTECHTSQVITLLSKAAGTKPITGTNTPGNSGSLTAGIPKTMTHGALR